MSDEPSTFEEFVAARGPTLARSAYLLTGDRHLAEDLLQSALARALPRWSRIEDPEAYLRRVLFTEHVSWWRRRRRLTEVPLDDHDAPARGDGADEDVPRRLAVEAALRSLTPKQRAVLVLRFYEDLSEAEAATVLGVSVGTVKSQTHVALKRLRALAGVHPDLSLPERN
ncbi:SigE family RNA polymerase sigma factor [Motilibacter deserti]|uniref:SigE family RNA polymerase sigma factor n=1 Tax=Motilibacter deserti TaxID=2714956 RepID=A0ABX0H0L6_9ACTN|nr:SigE family RNA polymerase sigma factor [Motilibacter deserti]NHC15451.1 SigE family RNA polymerase sigma factor [Motilibacter deserti]